jgi:hypothetical protein
MLKHSLFIQVSQSKIEYEFSHLKLVNENDSASLELVQKPSSRYSFVVAAPFLSLFAIKVMFYIERDISSVVMNLPSYLVTIVPGMR